MLGAGGGVRIKFMGNGCMSGGSVYVTVSIRFDCGMAGGFPFYVLGDGGLSVFTARV